jgi:hypothetical protein
VRESEIEKYLVQRVKAIDGEVRKVKWIGRSGAPDRLVMLPGRPTRSSSLANTPDGRVLYFPLRLGRPPQTVWVELKATGKKPEPHQLREHKRMRAMGQRVEVVDSIEGVEALLE